MDAQTNYIGRGIYGIAEAARLLRRPAAQVRRWANGYTYPRKYDIANRPPVLQTDRHDKSALTFQEMVELFFVREFTSSGISLPHIRQTAEALVKEFGEHPFASKQLLTDGRRLVAMSEHGFIAPASCQLLADFAGELVREFEFEDDFVRLWHPKEGHRVVVVDPSRAMGEPIIDSTGTPTRTIFRTFQKEQDFDRVADYYDLTAQQVKHAIEFELRFADAA